MLRRDLADFASTCNFTSDESYVLKTPARRGPALAAKGAVLKTDFNGDSVDDYVLNSAKLRCTRPLPGENGGASIVTAGFNMSGVLMIYTSTNAGGHIHSLDAAPTSYRITPVAPTGAGSKASLFLHQKFVPKDDSAPDGEGDAVPLVNETLTMRDERRWNSGQLGEPDWRLGILAAFPKEVHDQFAQWDSECAAVGRRMRVPVNGEGYFQGSPVMYLDAELDNSGNLRRTIPVDLNGDGKRDYVIDTDTLILRCVWRAVESAASLFLRPGLHPDRLSFAR